MTAFRSHAYSIIGLAWTIILCILYLPLLAAPRDVHRVAVRFWARGLLGLLWVVCGLRHRVVGRDNLPAGPALIAAKHQSAWETLALLVIARRPVFILKKELLRVPLIGWHFRKFGNIGIDRMHGATALRAMVPAAGAALAAGYQVIVFPEGTRVGVGEHRAYQPGIAALYARTTAPVVPVALNSGRFWGRRSAIRYPGTITIAFLPPIAAGLDRRTFMRELECRIEDASARLDGDGRDGEAAA
ncbi:MAG: 1-acyl-sn-glycerol-3-phosphate acyltransferase [Rhodospirillales bacterium]|nr:1-acyl-sn-glycerol-3-phosphate acyltransferase [Rhodospirillales bacterium]